jgi:hypothetical protein
VEKTDFEPDTRYSITWRDENGRLRPMNIYVYRLYDDFMVTRMTDKEGVLRRLAYGDVMKIVKTIPVRQEDRFFLPEATLAEANWKDRSMMQSYASSPHMGK